MSRACRITPLASRDIEAKRKRDESRSQIILAAQSSLTSAERSLSSINSTLQRIAQFSQIGRERDELYPGSRSLPYAQYLIFYRLLNDDIEVLRVVSGYQDLTAPFEDSP